MSCSLDILSALKDGDSLHAARGTRGVRSDDVRTTDVTDDLGRLQPTTIVNESGLYDLIFVSRKPAAKEFKRKVTTEILPEIRKSGMYLGGMSLQDALRKYADALDEKDRASRRAIEAEAYANELQPKAVQFDQFMDTDGLCSLGELAQALGGGRQRLIERLRELGILVSQAAAQGGTRPMQTYADKGWFVVKMEATKIGDVAATYATPKGVSGVFRAIVTHGVGTHRWGQIPTEEQLMLAVFSS